MTLSATGDAETPAGGSVCMRWFVSQLSWYVIIPGVWFNELLENPDAHYSTPEGSHQRKLSHTLKSRIRRRRAEVDIAAGYRDGCER